MAEILKDKGIKKRLIRILLYSLLALIVIPFSLSWMTYNPMVQTFLARIASSYLSKQLNTTIMIDELHITPRLDLHISGVLAQDLHNDTLFHAGDIFIDISSFHLKKSQKVFKVNDIKISEASFALIKDVNDSAFTYSFIRHHFESDDPSTEIDTIHGNTKWKVSFNNLDLSQVRFRYIDETKPRKEVGMDYANLDIFIHELQLENLNILNDTFDFSVNKLRCYDRCGFVLDEFSGNFRLSPMFLVADSLLVKTPNSDIDLDLVFDYHGWPSYLRFTDEVVMTSDIRPSEVNLIDIGHFAPHLLVMDNELRIGGQVKGSVNNLRVKDFRFTYGRNTRFRGDVRLYGLPDVRETYIHTSVDEFTITRSDIESFAIPGALRYIPVPDEIGILGTININGSFTGFYDDFVSTADFVSDIGSITTDISLRQNEDHTDVVYDGKLRARRFHIGKFLNLEDYLGEMDMEADIHGSGLSGETANINMTGNIDSLLFMQRTFNEVHVRGDIAEKKFNGHLNVKDDLVNFIFDGILDFNQEKPLFDFTADINDADLYKLNMLDRDSLLRLSVALNCNFIGLELEDLEGRVMIDSLEFTEGEKSWSMNHLALISLKDTGYYRRIMLTSDILDAVVQGSFTIREMTYAIDSLVNHQFSKWSFMPEPDFNLRDQSLAFSLEIKESDDFLEIFVPGLQIWNSSTIDGMFSSKEGIAEVTGLFPYVNYLGMQSDGIRILANAQEGRSSLNIKTDQILLKDRGMKDTLQLGLENFSLDCKLDQDSLKFALVWDDEDVIRRNMADIKGYYTFIDTSRSMLHFSKAYAIINDSLWTMSENNSMTFGKRYLEFSKFNFIGGQQKLMLQGKLSENPTDTMNVDFNNWRMSNFDIIYRNYNFDLNGIIDGTFGISNAYQMPNFFSNLNITDLEMNNVLIGDAEIRSLWNNNKQSVDIDSKIIYHGNVSDSRVMGLAGSYYPQKKTDNLNFTLEMNNFRIEALNSFVNSYVSDLSGVASAKLHISGSTKMPETQGQLKLMRSGCRIDYLNTIYSFAHTIDFNPGAISISNMIIYDSVGNQAIANGKITHNYLKDFYFDLSVKPQDFVCLYTNRYHNNVFYGDGIVSGEVKFYGPMDDFHIDADVETSKGADITIPLNNSLTVTENDFVVFRNEEKDIDEIASKYSVNLKGLNLDFRIGISNTAETMIILPGNMGNISSRGYGDIQFTVDPRGEFNIFGDYNFLGGTFFFSLQNLINRRFEIIQGGHIDFTGNPYNADVDLKALYRLKTSLSGLGASISPEFEGQRVNVNAFLGLRGKLANPDINFSIDFPNVKDEIKTTIYAVLDTNDAMLMNQQMVSLLLMNSFSYASSSPNMAGSSLNIVTSQLSNWLSQISRDFDIGINYISGDEINQDELEVALSTQFFDNRLIVDGNVGVMTTQKDASQQDASNIVGDVNIEYKLRPDGRIRLRAFNRSNNINTLDYYSPYTQGVGIFYTKEFDRFGDIFKRQRKKGEKLENEE